MTKLPFSAAGWASRCCRAAPTGRSSSRGRCARRRRRRGRARGAPCS